MTAETKTWISTKDLYRMMREGKIREGGPEYLWDGEIITPMPEKWFHFNAANNLAQLLLLRLPKAAWTVNVGNPIALADGYEPQPDVSVLRGPRSNYRTHTQTAADTALLVEVSSTTYRKDSGPFYRKYAQEGVVQYWIVNVPARRIEVYNAPDRAEGTYRERVDYPQGAIVPLVLTVGAAVSEFAGIGVDDVLRDSLEDDPEPAG